MRQQRLGLIALAIVGTFLAAGAAAASHLDDPADPNVPIDEPIPGHIQNAALQLELQTVTDGRGLTAPVWSTFAPAPGQQDVLYVVDQDGPLWAVDTDTGAKTVFLNTRSLLVQLGIAGPDSFDERGFLGLAFHPNYSANGLLYTYTSEPDRAGADYTCPPSAPCPNPDHESVIREWFVPAAGRNPDPAASPNNNDAAPLAGTSRATPVRILMRIDQPQFNHNAGTIFFGQRQGDRNLLYVFLGDGGAADDQGPGHNPTIGNAQDDSTVLGKILRVDPATTNSGAAPPVSAVIFAKGVRNPYRGSADRTDLGGTGQIWLGDAGQNHIEEIDRNVRQGDNLGWRQMEGNWRFNPLGPDEPGFAWACTTSSSCPQSTDPGFGKKPIAEYDHDEGVAVIGGFVYRGQEIDGLFGRYVFAEYSDGFSSGNGRVMVIRENDNADPHRRTPKIFNLINGTTNVFVLGMGEDRPGELYVLANERGVPFRETGHVLKLVENCAAGAECRD
jgi:hypothetical protein